MGKLTLSRLPGQTIVIGENAEIEVTVLRLRGRHVDISISASDNIPVNRLEIYQQKHGGEGVAVPAAAPRTEARAPTRPVIRRRRSAVGSED